MTCPKSLSTSLSLPQPNILHTSVKNKTVTSVCNISSEGDQGVDSISVKLKWTRSMSQLVCSHIG